MKEAVVQYVKNDLGDLVRDVFLSGILFTVALFVCYTDKSGDLIKFTVGIAVMLIFLGVIEDRGMAFTMKYSAFGALFITCVARILILIIVLATHLLTIGLDKIYEQLMALL